MKQLRQLLLSLLTAAVVTAPAVAQDDEEEIIAEEIPADLPPPEPACFNIRDVRNFDPIGSRFLWIEGRRDENYLLTIDRACFGLRNAEEIGFLNQTNRVCDNSQAKVRFVNLGRVEECVITTIESVADKDTAEVIAERRRQQN